MVQLRVAPAMQRVPPSAMRLGPQGPLGVRLEPPGDPADQVLLVPAADGLAKHFHVPLLELSDRQLLQGGDLLCDVQLHRSSPSLRGVNPRVPTLSLVSPGSSRRVSPEGGDFCVSMIPAAFARRCQRTTPRARIDAASRRWAVGGTSDGQSGGTRRLRCPLFVTYAAAGRGPVSDGTAGVSCTHPGPSFQFAARS
jgi:hypothetical protein